MEGLDIRPKPCRNMRQNDPAVSVTGAPSASATPPKSRAPVLTAKDIARLFGKPLRSAQRDIADAIAAGVPTVPVLARGRGKPPLAVDEAAYVAWRFGDSAAASLADAA